MAECLIYATTSWGKMIDPPLTKYNTKRSEILASDLTTAQKEKSLIVWKSKFVSRFGIGDIIEVRENGGFSKSPPLGPGAGWDTDKFALVCFTDDSRDTIEQYRNRTVFDSFIEGGTTIDAIKHKEQYKIEIRSVTINPGSVYMFKSISSVDFVDKTTI